MSTYTPGPDEHKANARLIAAAPELLAAALAVQATYLSISDLLDMEIGLSSTEWHAALDALDAAIAGATGANEPPAPRGAAGEGGS